MQPNESPLRTQPDDALWRAYVEGDDDAFAEVRRRYQPLLFRYLALSLSDLRQAAQHLGRVLTLVAAWRRPHEGFDSLKGWLLAIATQQVVPTHHREDPGLFDFLSDLRRSEPHDAEARARCALADMRREERQPLLLIVVGGLGLSEAARACRFRPERTARLVERAARELARSGVFPEV